MNDKVSILGMDFGLVFRDCRLTINTARLITGTPTTGKSTLCESLRTQAFPVIDSDEFVRVFAPEWNRERLWLRVDDVRKLFEDRMRFGFARAAVRCLLAPHGCVVTNWMGADLVPYLERHAYGNSPDLDGAEALQSAGISFYRAQDGGTVINTLPVIFVRSSASDVQRLSAGRLGQGTWSGGIPASLVRKWAHHWVPMDLSGRYSKMVYLGLPAADDSGLVFILERLRDKKVAVLVHPLGEDRFLCRLDYSFESSRGHASMAYFFFTAFAATDGLSLVTGEDDLFIADVINVAYGLPESTFLYQPVTLEGCAKDVDRELQGS